MKDVLKQLKGVTDYFHDEPLELNPTYAKTHPELLKMIDHYRASKYMGDEGPKDLFYNVINNPTLVAAKMVDIDQKNIKVTPDVGGNKYEAWIYQALLKLWMEENNFGRLINKLVYQLPRYGSVMAKKSATIESTPIRNIVLNPKVWGLDWPFVEVHPYSLTRFLRVGKKKGWDNVDYIYRRFDKEHEREIVVYEVYGDLGDTRDNFFLLAGTEDCKFPLDKRSVLYSTRMNLEKEFPYKDAHWDRLMGRYLGFGQSERLLENQIAKNYNEKLLREGLKWTSLRLFQTNDDTLARNLLQSAENGDVFQVNAGIERIAMEERNLSAFSYYDDKWNMNTELKGFTHDVMKGKRPPSGTPLGTSLLQAKMAGGYFDLKRESLGMFLKELIQDWVIPEFEKAHKDNYELLLKELDSDKIEILRRNYLKNYEEREFFEHIRRTNKIPGQKKRKVFKQLAQEEALNRKFLDLPRDFIKRARVKTDVEITGEQVDRAGKFSIIQTALQIVGSNPTILERPRTRKIFYKLLEQGGWNPAEIDVERPMKEGTRGMPQLKQGGSISPVAPPKRPVTTTKIQEV